MASTAMSEPPAESKGAATDSVIQVRGLTKVFKDFWLRPNDNPTSASVNISVRGSTNNG